MYVNVFPCNHLDIWMILCFLLAFNARVGEIQFVPVLNAKLRLTRLQTIFSCSSSTSNDSCSRILLTPFCIYVHIRVALFPSNTPSPFHFSVTVQTYTYLLTHLCYLFVVVVIVDFVIFKSIKKRFWRSRKVVCFCAFQRAYTYIRAAHEKLFRIYCSSTHF